MQQKQITPKISVIIVIFNMQREVKRTLFSLSLQYQEGVNASDYEVIVIDNGSSEPLSEEYVRSFGDNFSYYYLKDTKPSPAYAINFGANRARGEIIGIMIDGARILTPGVIKYALSAADLSKEAVIATLGWHLGPDIQNKSIMNGYDSKAEDRLLDDIAWLKNGYRLFEISSLAGSSKNGWLMPIAESNCLFMSKSLFKKLGGCDERFDLPGGGLLNLDLYREVCEHKDTTLFYILGEGNFHQVHNGICTNASPEQQQAQLKGYFDQYSRIRSKAYSMPEKKINYIGHVPKEALKFIQISINNANAKKQQ